MKKETYNTRLKPNPEDIPVGSLLRVKKHCRKSVIIRQNGEYAILAPSIGGKYFSYDVVFPNGTRSLFMPLNWEVISYA